MSERRDHRCPNCGKYVAPDGPRAYFMWDEDGENMEVHCDHICAQQWQAKNDLTDKDNQSWMLAEALA